MRRIIAGDWIFFTALGRTSWYELSLEEKEDSEYVESSEDSEASTNLSLWKMESENRAMAFAQICCRFYRNWVSSPFTFSRNFTF
jgi:hypothetical protein